MQTTNPTKKANLTLPILIAMVVGNMIGTGIFILPATLAAYGTISVFSWIFTSLGAIFLALTFANLNKRYPKTGGPYIFAKEAYGEFIGFLVAYTYWISVCISNAALAVGAVSYLGIVWQGLNEQAGTYHPAIAFFIKIAVVWVFTLINIHGIRTAGIVQVFLTILKVLPLLIIVVVGIFAIHPEYLLMFNISKEANFVALTNAATLTLWAFIGLETATIPADETTGSADVYKATVYGTLIVAGIYILSTIVIMGLIPATTLKNSQFPFAEAAMQLFGNKAGFIMGLCAVISGLGALNVNILLQGQVPMAAARDNLFPRVFAKQSPRKTPANALMISSCLVTVLLILTFNASLIKQFTTVALLATLATLAAYFISAMAELMLLVNESAHFNRGQLIKSSIIAVLAGAYAFWMIIGTGMESVFYGTLLLFSSFPAYIWLRRRNLKIATKNQVFKQSIL